MNRKKIGIITCCREPNYGACLQAFATQQVVEKMGYDAEIMNYSFQDEKSYLPWKQKSISSFVACVLFFSLRKSIYIAFSEFHSCMKFSAKQLINVEDFKMMLDDYDVFLVGSDQVWNPYLGIDINISLLNFYRKGPKKISYASSFGVTELPERLTFKYKDAFSQFSSMSTREESGKSIIQGLINKEVPVVLDPTLLLNREEWLQHSKNYVFNEPYLLLYDMQHTSNLVNLAVQIAKSNGWKVLALSRVYLKNPNVKVLKGIGPGQFISLIDNAQMIITDSFHGTTFSINLHKNFYCYCGEGGRKLSTRILNILEKLQLQDRLLVDLNELPVMDDVNYVEVDEKLQFMRNESMTYLKEALAGD